MSATSSTSTAINICSDAAPMTAPVDLPSGGRLKRWMRAQKQLLISCFSPAPVAPVAPRTPQRAILSPLTNAVPSRSTVRLSRPDMHLSTSNIPRILGAADSASGLTSPLHLEIPPSPMSFLTNTSTASDWTNLPHSAIASSDHGHSFSPTDALPAHASSDLEGRLRAMMDRQAEEQCAPLEFAQSTLAVHECDDEDRVDPVLPPLLEPLHRRRMAVYVNDEEELDDTTSSVHSAWSTSEMRARGQLVAWWSNQSLRAHCHSHELSSSTIVSSTIDGSSGQAEESIGITRKVHVPTPLKLTSNNSGPSTAKSREHWPASICTPVCLSHEPSQASPTSSSECSTATGLFSASSDATTASTESCSSALIIASSTSTTTLVDVCRPPKPYTGHEGTSSGDKARLHQSLLDFANLITSGSLLDQDASCIEQPLTFPSRPVDNPSRSTPYSAGSISLIHYSSSQGNVWSSRTSAMTCESLTLAPSPTIIPSSISAAVERRSSVPASSPRTKRILIKGRSSLSALAVLSWAGRHGTVASLHRRGRDIFVEWRGAGARGIEADVSCLGPVQLCAV